MAVGRKRKTDKHLPARVYSKHGQYYYVCRDRELTTLGKRWNPLGPDLGEALKRYAQIIQPACGDDLNAVWHRYASTALAENSPRTQQDKRGYWSRLAPVFGACYPDDVRPSHIRAYLDAVKGRQGNLHVSLLQHMYARAIEWEMASTNPCVGVRRNAEGVRRVSISDQQLADWLAHCPPMLRCYSLMQYLVGLRKCDLIRLQLSQISQGRWRFTSSKTAKVAAFPVTPAVQHCIKLAREHRTDPAGVETISDYLISRADGKPYAINGFDSMWKHSMADFAGERFAPNDLRKKHAVDIERQGGDASINLQHTSRQVTAHNYLYEGSIAPVTPAAGLIKILDDDG